MRFCRNAEFVWYGLQFILDVAELHTIIKKNQVGPITIFRVDSDNYTGATRVR